MSILEGKLIYNNSDERPVSLIYHPTIKSAIAITREGKIIVIDLKDDSFKEEKVTNDSLDFIGMIDKDTFVVAGNDIKIYDSSLKELQSFKPHEDSIIGVAANENLIISASEDGKVIQTDRNTNRSQNLYKHNSPIISFDYSKSKNLIATSCSDSEIIIYDLATKARLSAKTLDHKVWSLKFSLDGNFLFAGDHEGCITVYKTPSLEVHLPSKSIHESRIKSLAISPDGKYLVSSSFDTKVRVMEVKNLEQVKDHELHSDWVRSAIFDSNSQTVYSCGDDGKIAKFQFRENTPPKSSQSSPFVYLGTFILFGFILVFFSYESFFQQGDKNSSIPGHGGQTEDSLRNESQKSQETSINLTKVEEPAEVESLNTPIDEPSNEDKRIENLIQVDNLQERVGVVSKNSQENFEKPLENEGGRDLDSDNQQSPDPETQKTATDQPSTEKIQDSNQEDKNHIDENNNRLKPEL